MQRGTGAAFDFFSDRGMELVDLLGLRHAGGGPTGGDITQSASFLFSPQGEILWQHRAENYRVRPHPGEIVAEVDRLLAAPPG